MIIAPEWRNPSPMMHFSFAVGVWGMGRIQARNFVRLMTVGVSVALWFSIGLGSANASSWTEESFANRIPTRYPVRAADVGVVGDLETYVVEEGDTLLDVGRHFDLGYNEMTSANPGVDPWMPSPQEVLLIPTEFVLPEARPRGVIVNIPEMRLYYFQNGTVVTYPVGLGRDDWRTPEGSFKIRGKTENPTWVIPESIRAEHIRERDDPRTFIAGGDPENPLGLFRLELTLPLYALHGSNMPWGVGMQVSHGCIRLYNEDIAILFREVQVGTPGEFLYQPVKLGERNGEIFIEVHPDIYALRGNLEEEAQRILARKGWSDRIDLDRVRRAIKDQAGLPMSISLREGRETTEPREP
jgi:L,D-transpeptidase ErfK/SrfK